MSIQSIISFHFSLAPLSLIKCNFTRISCLNHSNNFSTGLPTHITLLSSYHHHLSFPTICSLPSIETAKNTHLITSYPRLKPFTRCPLLLSKSPNVYLDGLPSSYLCLLSPASHTSPAPHNVFLSPKLSTHNCLFLGYIHFPTSSLFFTRATPINTLGLLFIQQFFKRAFSDPWKG